MRHVIALLLVVLALSAAPAAKADYFIVVSDRNPVAAMSQNEVLQLFMGRSRSYPDGRPAVAYDIADDALRSGFYRSLSGMSLAQVNSYWARLMFSGRSLPPQRVNSVAAMIVLLERDPQAIGWLPEAPKRNGLRTILVLKAAP